MAYRLDLSRPDLADDIRRIAAEQLQAGRASLDDLDGDLHARVHDARKRIKKVRALLRLVRPALPAYAEENRRLRDAARLLSGFRDRTAVIETYDRLVHRQAEGIDRSATAPLRRRLTQARNAVARDPDLGDRIAALRGAIAEAEARLPDWTLEAGGIDAVAPGLKKTLKRARKALAEADAVRTDAAMHDWRKRVKYHWYHMRLVAPVWPRLIEPRRDAARQLGRLLGDHSDLGAFEPILHDPDTPDRARRALIRPLNGERHRLEIEAFALGALLLAEAPKASVNRWAAWWQIRRAEALSEG